MPEQERTAAANIPGLRNATSTEFVEFLASLSHETKRIPDPYSYSVTDQGEFFSPVGQCLVKDTIGDKTSPLGRLEYQAVLANEQWAASNKEGVSVWISPPKAGIYPSAKIIVQEIEYEEGAKKIFNRAIVLDFDEDWCMQFAWNLTSFSRNKPIFRSLDEIRAVPLILDIHGKNWVDILEKLIDTPKVWTMIKNGEDRQYKEMALRQATWVQKEFFADSRLSYSEEAKLAVMHMLGSHGGSCPVVMKKTAFGVFSDSSLSIGSSSSLESDQYGSLEFECPKCKKTNRRSKGQLIPNCQHCNADVRC